jgi:hypothetical protein
MPDPKTPEQQKSLEMRVAELEDKLAKLHVTEEEMQAYRKVAALMGGGAMPMGGPMVMGAPGQAAPAPAPAPIGTPIVANCIWRCIIWRCIIWRCNIIRPECWECIQGPMGPAGGGFESFGM